MDGRKESLRLVPSHRASRIIERLLVRMIQLVDGQLESVDEVMDSLLRLGEPLHECDAGGGGRFIGSFAETVIDSVRPLMRHLDERIE